MYHGSVVYMYYINLSMREFVKIDLRIIPEDDISNKTLRL